MEEFNDLLKTNNGSPAGQVSALGASEPDPRPTDEVQIEPETAPVPTGGQACKIIDRKSVTGGVVTLHKDEKGHYQLSCTEDVKIPRGTKLASVGSGKPTEKQDKDAGIPLVFARQDRTWIELVQSNSAEGGDADADVKSKKGTLYTVAGLSW